MKNGECWRSEGEDSSSDESHGGMAPLYSSKDESDDSEYEDVEEVE